MNLTEKAFFYYCAFISLIITITAGFPMLVFFLPIFSYFAVSVWEQWRTKNSPSLTSSKLLNKKRRIYISLIIFALLLGIGVANVLRSLI